MKHILRSYLVNLGALWTVTQIFPAIFIKGGLQGLVVGAFAFMVANLLLLPLLKILLLPLNLLTFGIFAWLGNVLALYFLVTVVPFFQVSDYFFKGANINGFIFPAINLSVFQVVIVASFLIGFVIHFINWLIK